MKDVCELKECPDCASDNIVCHENKEQLVCRECGLIFEPLAPEAEKQFDESHATGSAKAKKSAAKKKK